MIDNDETHKERMDSMIGLTKAGLTMIGLTKAGLTKTNNDYFG